MLALAAVSSLLVITAASPSHHTSTSNKCNIELLNRRDVFQMSANGEKLRITMKMVEDNRPCQLSISLPGENRPQILTINKQQPSSSSNGISVKVKTLFKGLTLVKVLVLKQGATQSLRGAYNINGITIFGFPRSNEGLSEVKDAECKNDKAMGNIDMTEDLHMCCEYHRSRNSTEDPILGQCCNNCLLVTDHISVVIEYEKNKLEFLLEEGYQGEEAEVACVIQSEGVHEYKVRFQTNKVKDKC